MYENTFSLANINKITNGGNLSSRYNSDGGALADKFKGVLSKGVGIAKSKTQELKEKGNEIKEQALVKAQELKEKVLQKDKSPPQQADVSKETPAQSQGINQPSEKPKEQEILQPKEQSQQPAQQSAQEKPPEITLPKEQSSSKEDTPQKDPEEQKEVAGTDTGEKKPGIGEKLAMKINEIIEYIGRDFTPSKWKESNRPALWATMCIFSLFMLFGGMILSLYISIMIIIKRRRVQSIKIQNRYNIDHPEYLITRSKTLYSRELPFNLLIIMPAAAILSLGIIILHKIYKGNTLNERENTGITNTYQALEGTNQTINPVTLPLGIMFIVFVFCGLSFIIILPTYMSTKKQLKNIQSRIETFENGVFEKIYIEQNFLKILYNNGKPSDNLYDTIDKAIRSVMVKPDGTINKSIPSNNLEKMIYTLRLYEFLYEDLRDIEVLNTNYRTDAMQLFDYKLLALPGKSRIFRIADFMRSKIPPNMKDDVSLKNMVERVRKYILVRNTITTNIKTSLSTTYNRAFNIQASKAWGPIKTMTIVSFIAHWFIFLCVLLYFIIMWIKNKFF